jgi:RNA polymerase sigma-70 factor (ECF subfamily)
LNLNNAARDYTTEKMTDARERVLDELLVLRCQEGSRTAFDLLVRRWQRRLWRYARRLSGSDEAAWDIMQETWIAVLRQIRRLNDPAWFTAWVYRIVRNQYATYCRGASRQRKLREKLSRSQSVQDGRPQETHEGTVAAALRKLAPDRRDLLALKYGEALNVVEIAVILGVPVGTVKSRLHHARRQLRQILEGEDHELARR